MSLAELMREDLILMDLAETSKETVLQALVDHLVDRGVVEDGDEVLRLLTEREEMMTTGVRTGFAIPHAFPEQVGHSVVVMGHIPAGVEWQSFDQEPVHYVFLLLGPSQNAGAHLRLLARLSRLLSRTDFAHRLGLARTPAEVLHAVVASEQELAVERQPSGAQAGT